MADPLFPPQSVVLLLSGLPGDVESETSYRDQLRTWLELVAASQPRQVFVLCDEPAAVPTDTHLPLKVLAANRQSFLELGPALAGMTNPLVVLAWGHGGRQGTTPVLHVRGPRLTPADFVTVANQAKGNPSRWVLFFRGSGAFARQLAGPQRQVLSSEAETSFNSDPVGLSVLSGLVRGQPALSFDALATALGRGTGAWYAERNLARTEAPTLWLAEQPPRLLVEEAAPEHRPGAAQLAQANAAGAVVPQAATNLPADWKALPRVQAQQFPEADAVQLRRHLSYTLGSSPAVSSELDEYIQVLTPEGKRFGDFDISYSPPFEEVNFLACEVLRPDGTLLRLDPEAIREAQRESMGDYQFGRRKIFSLPGVEPGAVLHVRYQTQWKQFPLPYISLEIPLAEEMPALEATLQVSLPKEAPFHFALEHVSAPDPTLSQSSYGATYTWHFEHLAAYRPEVLAPPRQRPQILISTFADWPTFAGWYTRISQLADELTPDLTAKAKDLVKHARSDREKVLAIYNYVSGLRYVAVPVGVNSFRPHTAANVLQNQFGDCKDKANLFNALLRSLKLQAYLVLVPRFSQAWESTPGLAFNHAISKVLLDNQTLWVDTTDEVCRFGMLPPGDPGRKVLVIDGQSTNLTQLPAPVPSEHQLRLKGTVTCLSPGEALPMSLSATGQGYPDYQLRSTAREAKDYGASLPLLAAAYRPVAGAFALEKQNATRVSALDENFAWHAEGRGLGLLAASAQDWTIHAPFWVPQDWDQALHRRQGPLLLNQGYPLTLTEEFTFNLPARMQTGALPRARANAEGPLRWKIEWQMADPDKLVARFQAELLQGELSSQQTPELQRQLGELLAALSADARLLPAQ